MLQYILEQVIVPILIGVLSSVVFLLLLSRVRTSFEISSEIAKFRSKKPGHEFGYEVKILNNSRRSAVEVKVRFAVVRNPKVPGGFIMPSRDFTLEKDSQLEIPGFRKNNPGASAFRFLTYDNLEEVWGEHDYIIFVLFAKDSLTGFGRVFTNNTFAKIG